MSVTETPIANIQSDQNTKLEAKNGVTRERGRTEGERRLVNTAGSIRRDISVGHRSSVSLGKSALAHGGLDWTKDGGLEQG